MWYIHIKEYYLVLKKNEILMQVSDETWQYYAKWNKPDTRQEMLYILVNYLEWSKLQTKSKIVGEGRWTW
jgi:hypothetical protein